MTIKIPEKQSDTERLHEELHRMAIEQGVKPADKAEDLYVKSEIFDVDDFLTFVREIRLSDLIKNGE